MRTFRRFSQGDKVTYTGSKFAKELHGKLGIVDAHVDREPNEVVVTFDSDSYVMPENHLGKFQGKLREESAEKDDSKTPEVTKRRQVNTKRRTEEE